MHDHLHFQLPVGNEVELRIKLKFTDGTDIPASAIYDTHITIGVGGLNMKEYDFTTDGSALCIIIPADQELGSYDVHVSTHIDGRDIAAHFKGLIHRVQWGMAVPVPSVETDMIVFGETDEETQELKERLREAIAAAQAAQAAAEEEARRYAEAIHELDGIAKEETSQIISDKVDMAAVIAGHAKDSADAAKLAAEAAKEAAESITIPEDVTRKTDLLPLAHKTDLAPLAHKTDIPDVPTDYAKEGANAKTLDDVVEAIPEVPASIAKESSEGEIERKVSEVGTKVDGLDADTKEILSRIGDKPDGLTIFSMLTSIHGLVDLSAEQAIEDWNNIKPIK